MIKKRSLLVVAAMLCAALIIGCNSREVTAQATFVSASGAVATATYFADESVRVQLPGKAEIELPIAVSGSGARYANDHAEWWEHQGEATYRENDEILFSGKLEERE